MLASPFPPPSVLDAATRAIEESDGDHAVEAIEIVSNLPPVVIEAAPRIRASLPSARRTEEESPRAAFAVPLARPTTMRSSSSGSATPTGSGDRVDALLASFQVSRLRDDPALSRDLKEMIGIESAMPPIVEPRERIAATTSTSPMEIARGPRDPFETDAEPTPITYMPKRRGRRTMLALALVGIGFAAFVGARTPYGRATIAKLLAPLAPPPGDVAPKPTKLPAASPAPTPAKIPTVCEAKLDVDGAPKGAEIARKLGASPIAIAVPTHAPLDLVAVAPGSTPRRTHVDASAPWQDAPTGPRLELPLALDVGSDATWPAPAPKITDAPTAAPTTPKGLLRVTTNPSGATIWMVAESSTISGLPCGAPIDLRIAAPPAQPRVIHLEWAAFTGAPPHATLSLTP
jgi:hypothetical protein